MEDAILQYGYLAVFLVAAIEGEAALVIGAVLAQRGHLSLPGAIAASFAGTFVISELGYYFARRMGREWFVHRAGGSPRLAKVERLLQTKGAPIIFWSRFLWGIRIWIPVACGLGGVGRTRFAVWNLAGALFWTVLVAPIGWFFGEALQAMHEDAQAVMLWATAAIVVLTMAYVLWRLRADDEQPS